MAATDSRQARAWLARVVDITELLTGPPGTGCELNITGMLAPEPGCNRCGVMLDASFPDGVDPGCVVKVRIEYPRTGTEGEQGGAQ